MSSGLTIHVALSHPYVPSTSYLETPMYALLDLVPVSSPQTDEARPPLNLVLVIDSSATMHHLELSEEDREYWMGVAISRDELQRGEADEREAVYWTGQTLAEMQSIAKTPMSLAVAAIKGIFATLRPSDRVAVVAFADRVHTVFNEQDWELFPEQCQAQMDALRDQRLPVDIGTGTFMAEALRTAGGYLKQNMQPQGINRLVLISDGIVQDGPQTLETISEIQSQGIPITTVGVGEEFDEEFLIQVADRSRGEYHYAPTTAEITASLEREMTSLQQTTVTDLYLAARGQDGSVVQEMFLARPSMSLFDEIYTEEDWQRARIGDVSGAAPVGVLIQIAPSQHPDGIHNVAEVYLTWTNAGTAIGQEQETERLEITATYSSDPALLAETNPAVSELVDRFSIYKYEREAQRAQERGDIGLAREKLGAATRELHKIGETGLAQDMEGQMNALGDPEADLSRAKRIKATTRRLGATPTKDPQSAL